MSRRTSYLLGGLTAAVGVVLIAFAIIALTSDGDSSTPADEVRTTPRQATPAPGPAPEPPGESGRQQPAVEAHGRDIGRQLSRRRPVRAPGFSAQLVRAGSLPQALSDAFQRATADGALEISKLRGTPVVLYMWSSECAPCRANARLVEATWKRWGPRGVVFVGMHVDEELASTAEDVIRQYDLTFPAVADRNGAIARQHGVTALPQAFFISAAGSVVGEVVGAPSVRQLEVGSAATQSGAPFGSEQGSARAALR